MADLIFAEHAAQVARVRTAPASTRIVALAPEAMDALARAGLSYRRPDQYLETAALNATGRAAYAQVLAYCRMLDDWLLAELPALGRLAIAPATLFYYEFKILADTIALRAAELRAILEAERPSRVTAFPTIEDSADTGLLYVRESAYARLLPGIAAETGVALTWAGEPTAPLPACKEQAHLRQWVPARWRQRLAHFRSAGMKSLRGKAGGSGGTMLLLNVTPDIRAAMAHPAAAPWRFVHWAGDGRPMTLQPLGRGGDVRLDPLPAVEAIRDDATPSLRGLVPEPLEPLVRARVEAFVRAEVPKMAAVAAATDRVVNHYKPAIALAGILAGSGPRAVAARARELGVPLALYQHGGSYGYLDVPIHYYNDVMHADAFLTYGEGVTSSLARQFGSFTPSAELLSVGSAALAASITSTVGATPVRRARANGSGPTVLYAATCMMGQRFYAPHYRSCEYFALLTDAAAALDRAEGVSTVLKVHQRADNCFNPIADWCRRHAPRVRVVADGSLESWLEAADLVVMDLPATPLLEALARGRRVLAYCDERAFPIDAAARPLLAAAVRLETDREAFLAALTRAADLIDEPRDHSAAAVFLNRFATRADAPDRAMAALAAVGGRRPVLAGA